MPPQMNADGRGFLYSTLNSLSTVLSSEAEAKLEARRRRINPQPSTILSANLANLFHQQDFRDGSLGI